MQSLLETLVLAVFVALGIWLYSLLLANRTRHQSVEKQKIVVRFRIIASALAILCFVVGLLYRLHVISLPLAGILYIPEVLLFVVGMWRLQPYLTPDEEEYRNE